MEGEIGAVSGLCAHGRGPRWLGGMFDYCVSPISDRKLTSCSKTVLVLKYVVPEYPFPTLYFGIANVIANGLIMLR